MLIIFNESEGFMFVIIFFEDHETNLIVVNEKCRITKIVNIL